MSIEIKMPALSPTMEEGTLANWLIKEGDTVSAGDLMAEIETDKATMEFEAVDEGTLAKILVPAGTDNVKVGTVIALLAEEDEDASDVKAPAKKEAAPAKTEAKKEEKPAAEAKASPAPAAAPAPAPARANGADDGRVKASPLARRIAAEKGVDVAAISGSGPNGRVVKADVESAEPGSAPAPAPSKAAPAPAAAATPAPSGPPSDIPFDESIPHETEKLSNMRKVIAKRLTEAKQTIPHIYLTVDIVLDPLLKLRGELNKTLESRGVKLSVNDMLIKALGIALEMTPKCNVTYGGSVLVKYQRADVSVAVSTPAGLITPIIKDAANKSMSTISKEMKDLATRAKEGKLQPHEYQGGTASISNMGMFGISQFDAVINPPQGMILAISAGEKRPWVVDDSLQIRTVMSATGSFDHRAIDGADGAVLMKAFKELVESPMGMLA
ncbi:pyruvate dehydrogenase complex dihydrolipoamide acetyltransferase [Stakelama tenebrarum]|uniref:Acetyltransferase component of pyruvate dehydrogenase complex n=1 Tax=Stakelama tenebrarum TaxID=2711215 RepID=A0A6G6Y8Q1_9SPHN|nr:pyruvate dehydrogenase complex dihydrolipoamide acetyltransferase [Sphingosinithalassobacter tenebrarum]QIG81290.1 pyruvate dehydrogenase complex dihydrolipoamide acetyltransferase [Sphingosinithalassobacter tenebrarum]